MTENLQYSKLNDKYCVGTNNGVANGFIPGSQIPEIVEIPSHHQGIPVIAIGDSAFFQCTQIREVKIYAQIELIYPYAFMGCINLKSINIPASCKILGEAALDGRKSNGEDISGNEYNQMITIIFEAGSSLQFLNHSSISNTRKMRVYLYDKINPICKSYIFGYVNDLKIYAPYSFRFCGVRTTLYENASVFCRGKFLMKSLVFLYVFTLSK